jgi:hypothetical protein
MQLRSPQYLAFGAILIVALVIAFIILYGNPLAFGGPDSALIRMPHDASRLAVIAEENGVPVIYVGREDGALEKLPPTPYGDRFITVARGAQRLMVLTESPSGSNAIYEFVGGEYIERYRDRGLLPFLEVSPDGSRVGFISTESGAPTAMTVGVGAGDPRPIALGYAQQVRFFTHNGVPGVWLLDRSVLSFRTETDGAWSNPTIVYEAEDVIPFFALNGASRFAYKTPDTGQTYELAIDSLEPFATSSSGIYAPDGYNALFFWGNDFYALQYPDVEGEVALYPLNAPGDRKVYPVSGAIPEIVSVVPLQ